MFGFIGAVVIFVDIPANQKIAAGLACIAVLIVAYLWLWYRANSLREINLTIEESTVIIKTGDIFKQEGLKTIAFNEYFDTQVDERIIAESSLNGKFINEQDLLKIMLWTFTISEMRFKHPAKLTIMIHEGKIDKVNLLELKTARNGL